MCDDINEQIFYFVSLQHRFVIFLKSKRDSEQIRNPHSRKEIATPRLFVALIQTNFEKIENIGVPRVSSALHHQLACGEVCFACASFFGRFGGGQYSFWFLLKWKRKFATDFHRMCFGVKYPLVQINFIARAKSQI